MANIIYQIQEAVTRAIGLSKTTAQMLFYSRDTKNLTVKDDLGAIHDFPSIETIQNPSNNFATLVGVDWQGTAENVQGALDELYNNSGNGSSGNVYFIQDLASLKFALSDTNYLDKHLVFTKNLVLDADFVDSYTYLGKVGLQNFYDLVFEFDLPANCSVTMESKVSFYSQAQSAEYSTPNSLNILMDLSVFPLGVDESNYARKVTLKNLGANPNTLTKCFSEMAINLVGFGTNTSPTTGGSGNSDYWCQFDFLLGNSSRFDFYRVDHKENTTLRPQFRISTNVRAYNIGTITGLGGLIENDNSVYKSLTYDATTPMTLSLDIIRPYLKNTGGGASPANIGTGIGLYKNTTGTANFRSLKQGMNTSLVNNGDDITINFNSTTAGVTNRVYLNPLDLIVNSVTYNTLTTADAGLTSETQTVSSNNTIQTFATAFISDPYIDNGIIHSGSYTSYLWVNTDNEAQEIEYYIDVHLCDNLGVNISLLATLSSGGLVLSDSNDHLIPLTATLALDTPYVLGQRIKFTAKAIKRTTIGGAQTLAIKYGLTHQSFIDVPVSITTDMITDSRNGQILTTSLSNLIAKDGTTTTTAQIPFAQGLSSALGMSITTAFGDGSAIKIPNSSWIRPQTEQGGFYLTNGSNPSALNSVLHLTNSGSLFSCGDGVDQFGQISIGSGGTSIYHNENGSSNSSVLLGTNYATLYSGDNSNLVVTSNSATMYGGDSNLILNNTYASLYQAGSGFYIDATGIKPQGISAGTVSANSFVGLNSAGYLVKSPALSTTTAGVLTRVYLNPLDVIVNGTTYNTLTSAGAGATNETQSVSSNNTLQTFATSFISDGYLTDGIIHAGGYTANIWVNTNNCNHEVDYYIDVYLTDALGVNISLLGTLASGGLVLADNNDHTIQLTAYTSADVPYVVGQRVKFVVKAIANTAGGGAHTLSIKYGLTHASYIDIPVDITTDMVTDTRNGDILTASLNALQPLDADLTAIAGLTADGLLRKTSGVWGMDSTVYVTQTALDLKANIASPTFTGTVSGITSAMVGLGNVDNTSDANKPVSTATQTALNLKANIASPTFTGNPLAPTPALGDNDTSIATTAFVRSAINSVTAVASTATLTVNSLTTTQANITAQAVALTIASPTGGVDGRKLIIRIKDDNTARGITWNAIFRAIGVTLPLTTVAGKILYVGAIYNSTETKWDVVSVAQQA